MILHGTTSRSSPLMEHDLFRKTGFHFSGSCSNSALAMRVLGEHVVALLHRGVTGQTAFCVVSLRRGRRLGCRTKRIGRRIVLERSPSPSRAVGEPLSCF